jgi:hypothetical protein
MTKKQKQRLEDARVELEQVAMRLRDLEIELGTIDGVRPDGDPDQEAADAIADIAQSIEESAEELGDLCDA